MSSTLLALLLVPSLARAQAQVTVPPSDGWVTDLAGLLSAAEEQALEARLESYRQGTGHELALLVVTSLEGNAIENLALATAREWGLGREGENDGALLLVAQAERKLRIEVGRGLEGGLTDSISGRIIRDVITPRFREGDWYGGLEQGIAAMHAAIGGDYGPLERSAGGRAQAGGMIALLFVLVIVALAVFGARGRRGLGAGGTGDMLTWVLLGSMLGGRGGHGYRGGSGGGRGGGFGGFGGGGGFSGGGASGGW